MGERRYEVVTYSNDIGTDERTDYNHFHLAVKAAESYRKTEEYAAVYDRAKKAAYVIFGNPLTPVFASYVTVNKV